MSQHEKSGPKHLHRNKIQIQIVKGLNYYCHMLEQTKCISMLRIMP